MSSDDKTHINVKVNSFLANNKNCLLSIRLQIILLTDSLDGVHKKSDT